MNPPLPDPDALHGRLRALTVTADRAVADVDPHALARASLSRTRQLRRDRRHRGIGLTAAALTVAALMAGVAGLAGPGAGPEAPAVGATPTPTPTSTYLPTQPSREQKATLAALPQTHVQLEDEVAYARLGLPYDPGPTPRNQRITVHLPDGRTVPLGTGYVPRASLSSDAAYAVVNLCDEAGPTPSVQFGDPNPGRLVIVEMSTGRTTEIPNPGEWAMVGRTLVLGTPAGPPQGAPANFHFVLRTFPPGTFPQGVTRPGPPDGQIVASSSTAGLLLTWYQTGHQTGDEYTLYDVDQREAVDLPARLPARLDVSRISQDGRLLLGRAGEVWDRSTGREVGGLPDWLVRFSTLPLMGADGRFVFVLSMPASPTYVGVVACDPRDWDGTGTMPCARVVLEGGIGVFYRQLERDVQTALSASPSASG